MTNDDLKRSLATLNSHESKPPSRASIDAGQPEARESNDQTSDDALLSVRDLSIDIHGMPIVHDVSFTLSQGEVLAIVGESGAGKSMTAMAVPRLLPAGATVRGSIVYDRSDLAKLSDKGMRRIRGVEVACVYQEPMTALNPLYTVRQHLTEAIGSHTLRGTSKRPRETEELLNLVGLSPGLLGRYPHQLSGGQRQRVMIAAALTWSPRLLIADEPTTALDVSTQARLLTLFRRLADDDGMAVIFVTHDMGVVADIADSVVVMKNGAVVERNGVYKTFDAPTSPYTASLVAAAKALHGLDASEAPGVVVDHPAGEMAPDGQLPAPVETLSDAAPNAGLEVENLTVFYRRSAKRRRHEADAEPAVRDVSLAVARGETLGIVGESGSGKSTIARSILGLVTCSSGTVALDGVNIVGLRGRSMRAARAHLGVVFQDPTSSLDPNLPLWRLVTEPLWRHGLVKDAGELRRRAAELLTQVDLDPNWIARRRHELSGGQRQRIAIARAVSHRPHLLVADEPTSALDVTVQVKVLELLDRLQREYNFACVFISHDLYVVATVADRVLVMKDGRMVEHGPTAQVIDNPTSAYTRSLIGAIPVPDPAVQRAR